MRCALMVVAFVLSSPPLFAQSNPSPFAIHAGAAFAMLPESEFEVVRSLSGQDLFVELDARDRSADFGVFLSQRLATASEAPLGVYGTVGTGLSAPGRTLYFGGSLGVSRALLTVGLATGLVDSGASPHPMSCSAPARSGRSTAVSRGRGNGDSSSPARLRCIAEATTQ